jgi:hypothetical protein
MLLTVLEPAYFFQQSEFAKALHADGVVWANTFQFRRHSTINRAAIKTVHGAQWLTVPVFSRGKSGQTIRDTGIQRQKEWPATHLKTLEINYRVTPYYDFYLDEIEEIFRESWLHLDPLLSRVFRALAPARLAAALTTSAELAVCADRTQRILEWTHQLAADSYLLWPHEIALVDVARLQKAGIALYTFRFKAPEYRQSFGEYIPNLSVLDLWCNAGPAGPGLLHKAGQTTKI